MFTFHPRRIVLAFCAILLAGAFAAPAQQAPGPAPAKKNLTLDDYEKWSRIASTSISPDGAWISYAYASEQGRDEALLQESRTRARPYEIAGGDRPEFSDDSKWAAYLINPSDEERDKLQKANQPVVVKAELRNLATGDVVRYDNVQSIAFIAGGAFFMVKKTKTSKTPNTAGPISSSGISKPESTRTSATSAPSPANKPGTLLRVHDRRGRSGRATDSSFSTSGRASGPSSIRERPITPSSPGTRPERRLACLKGAEEKGLSSRRKTSSSPSADADRARAQDCGLRSGRGQNLPEGPGPQRDGRPSAGPRTRRGSFSGSRSRNPRPTRTRQGQVARNVDVWHYKDEQIQSVQMSRAAQERNRTWSVGASISTGPEVRPPRRTIRCAGLPGTEDGRLVVGSDPKPYLSDLNWGGAPADYYLVDTATGRRTLIEKKNRPADGPSPDGKWFLYLKDKQVFGGRAGDRTEDQPDRLGPR